MGNDGKVLSGVCRGNIPLVLWRFKFWGFLFGALLWVLLLLALVCLVERYSGGVCLGSFRKKTIYENQQTMLPRAKCLPETFWWFCVLLHQKQWQRVFFQKVIFRSRTDLNSPSMKASSVWLGNLWYCFK